jgi:hypothetical protein
MPITWNIRKSSVLLLLLLLGTGHLSAQRSYQTGFLGSVNLNRSLKDPYDVNVKMENRLIGWRGVQDGIGGKDVYCDLTDVSMLFSRKTGLSAKWAAGYLWRMRDGVSSHRLMQQYIWVRPYNSFRMAWRLAADQTFGRGEESVFRIRCRATAEVPLGGQRVDPGEWYWKLQGEFLVAKVESDFQPEWRAVSLFGYEISERNKLEMGLDYRSRSFHRPDASSQIWLNVNWFVRI